MTKSSAVWDRALAPFRKLIIVQGEVAFAYNVLHEKFFNLFDLVETLERPSIPPAQQVKYYPYALAIWHVLQNDRQQRELVLTALANLPTTLDIKGGVKRLQWAQKQTDELANYRNLIIHAPMQFAYPFADIFGGDHIPPPTPKIGSISTKPVHARRLRLIKSERFWKTLRNDCMNLKDYVEFTTRQIAWREYERQNGAPVLGALRAWPRRPRLPSIRKIKMIEQSLKRQGLAQTKRRKRPPPSGGVRPAKLPP